MAILNNLIVNGSSRFLNDAYFNILAADTGRFNKLATKVLGNDGETITVHGLMDVQGELHTKSWSNSNIATIDGSFFICPTLKVTETGSTSNGLTITQSGNTWSVQITSSSAVVTNSVYTMDSSGTVTTTGTWTLGSKVAITGEILVNNEWLPLGTLRGIITDRSSDLKSVTISNITDGYSSSNNILNTIGVQSNVKHRNIKISLYEWTLSDSSTPTTATTNPIGIYMTALGDGTGQTMIDIYGGQEPSGTTYKGLAKPYVRIGNLSGLSNLSVGGQNPKGWGIYTSNGYFEGTIAARRGYIGNNTKYWTIGTSGTNSTIFSGPTTVSATGTAGTYLGTDGFLNTASASVYAQITNGILTAKGVDITGKITASSGSIAGWRIESSYLASGSATAPGANVLLLSPSGTSSSYTVAGQAKTGWMITAGTTFGVNKDGGVYATSGKIGGWNITASSIQTGNYNTANTMYFGTSGLSLGTAFKVTSAGALTATDADITGKITANSGIIGGWNIGTDTNKSLYSGGSATAPVPAASAVILSKGVTSSTAVGGSSGSKTWMITAGTGFGVTTAGAMYANSGYIANWKIESNDLVTGTWGTDNSAMLCTGTSSAKSIGGSGNISGWVFTAGANFGVTKTGALYATSANITGTVDATSFTAKSYSGNTLKRQMSLGADGLKLMDGSGVILSQIDGSASTIGKTSGNSYNLNITGTAIDLRYNTNVLNRINSSGMTLYDGSGVTNNNNIIAQFNTNGAQLGKNNGSQSYLKLDYHSLQMLDKETADIIANAPEWKGSDTYEVGDIVKSGDKYYKCKTAIPTPISPFDVSYWDRIYPSPYLYVSDLRDQDGVAVLTEKAVIDPENMDTIYVTYPITNGVRNISINGNNENTFTEYVGQAYVKILSPTLQTDDDILVEYGTNGSGTFGPMTGGLEIPANIMKAYTLGVRKGGSITGIMSFAEGYETTASGFFAHAEGYGSIASGPYSHAEGGETEASSDGSHAEGTGTHAVASNSHAEGAYTRSSGSSGSHAEGANTHAEGSCSHAEGVSTLAHNYATHSEGAYTRAEGMYSHTQNYYTVATRRCQTVIGQYNEAGRQTYGDSVFYTDSGDYSFIIGNGTADDVRSNALTVDWDGNVNAAGAFFSNGAEFSKQASNHIVIGGYHVCWGTLTVNSPTLNAYAEQTVTLPYTYTGTPFCIASCANRAARARTAYASQGDQTGNKIRVGYYATASDVILINYLTIGV